MMRFGRPGESLRATTRCRENLRRAEFGHAGREAGKSVRARIWPLTRNRGEVQGGKEERDLHVRITAEQGDSEDRAR